MRIERCCPNVRLPGGERRWRKMARLAKFKGTVRIRPFTHKAKLGAGWEMGEYRPSKSAIRVRVFHDHGLPLVINGYDPLGTFGHELGHHILRLRGRPWASDFKSVSAQSRDPIERACDRYSKILQARS